MVNLLIPLCAIAGFYLTTRQSRVQRKAGAIIGLAGQPLWFMSVSLADWGVLIVVIFFTLIYLNVAITSWRPQHG